MKTEQKNGRTLLRAEENGYLVKGNNPKFLFKTIYLARGNRGDNIRDATAEEIEAYHAYIQSLRTPTDTPSDDRTEIPADEATETPPAETAGEPSAEQPAAV